MTDELDIRTAIKDTLPTVFGYIGIGLAFGVVSQSVGLSVLMVVLMSAITYAGSAQFIMVSMLVSHNPVVSIMVAVFLVSARMILMSTVVAPYFKKDSMWRNIFIGALLTDESFALSMNKVNYTEHKMSFEWFNTANLIAYFTWMIASGVGALLGQLVAHPERLGLDFALVAMFIGLLYLQVIADRSLAKSLQLIVILAEAVIIYLGLIFIPGNLLLVVGTLLGCATGVVIKHAFY